MIGRVCEKCNESPSVKSDEKYCKHCRKALLKELIESGYLTPRQYTRYRSADQREAINETKWGVDR